MGAVVAVFSPGPGLAAVVATTSAQVDAVVLVVDEHPVGPATREVLDACRVAGADVVEHGANRGIGAALNTGTARLGDLLPGLDHVLTLDQDSALPEGYVAALVEAHDRARAAGVAVGMVAPDQVGSMVRLPRRGPGRDGVVLGGEPIQSGLLVPVGVLDRLGGMDESLFIDGVDTDFYLRARDAGLRCVLAPGSRLEHRLGQAVRAGDRETPLLVAATFRYHYQWRNLVVLLRRHARRHPVWSVAATVRAVRHLAIVTVVTPGRGARLRAAYAGLRAGLRGETGPRA